MRILVTNDDGVHSPGIEALAASLADVGEVWIVAPDRERSAASHSISLHRPLRISKLRDRVFTTDGTPADCVYLAVNHLLRELRPDVVASGINKGPNLADDITYSGTVAAALEATMLGIPAVAFSSAARTAKQDFVAAARFAKSLIGGLGGHSLQPGVLLNVNVPPESDGVTYRVTRQGRRAYGQEVVEREDPRGRRYYWIGGDELAHENLPGSDANAVYDEGLISVTPLHMDLTHDSAREQLLSWTFPRRDATRESFVSHRGGVTPWRALALGALLSACRTAAPGVPDDLSDGRQATGGVRHTVAKGQTLWRIAYAYGVPPQELAEVNDLQDPTKIQVGQRLWIPRATHVIDVPPAPTLAPRSTVAPVARKTAAPPERTSAPKPPAATTVAVAPVSDPDPPLPPDDPAEPKVEVKHSRFIWPVKGAVESRFGVREGSQHDGIDIAGPMGAPIAAADAGEVIYAGVQRGYGNLVLIKHADGLITVYAHNSENDVAVGAHVQQGQQIALIGQTGRATNPHVHFEVRQERIPRNPLFFLP